MPPIDLIRSKFPALAAAEPLAFLENAGGSQVPHSVIDAIAAYMRTSYVQLNAGYELSRRASETVERAHRFMNDVVGGGVHGATILGPSSTQLLHMLAGCWSKLLRPGDEIVVAESNHEANIGAWLALVHQGVRVRWWHVGDDAAGAPIDALDGLLGERTRLVCFPHVSNLLGGVVDVAEVAKRARAVGARTVVDGVAFAPHRLVDVAALGCDWHVFSTYKFFGPHMAALFGTHEAIRELDGPNHFFIPRTNVPYVFELGGASHEGCAGLLGLAPYLRFLAGAGDDSTSDLPTRAEIVRAMSHVTELELPLQSRLVERLASIEGVRLLGPATGGLERVPTVSFVHERVGSQRIAAHAHRSKVALRNGHMYSYRLCEAMDIPVEHGVVRISAVHYNTLEEIDRALSAVRSAIAAG